ncbi:hypothetical protein HYR69_07400 [Candidatus Sumerlaeota bacterium]|nr:hypothetical protein [Candidatus Sumerlaeota bacterium]
MKKTKGEVILGHVEAYRAYGNPWPVPAKKIAAWAIDTNRYEPKARSIYSIGGREFADAMRMDHFTDPQGREVRRFHALRAVEELGEFETEGIEQLTFEWLDLRTDDPKKLKMAFQQKRGLILNDCKALKTDVESYNENFNPGEPIQLCFDFSEDLAELAEPVEYRGLPD